MGLHKLLIFFVFMVATLHCSATVSSPSYTLHTSASSVQKQGGLDFRTINLFYSTSKSFSGCMLLSDSANYFHFDHNSYSRKISLFCSSDITLFRKSTKYFKGLEKYDCVPCTESSYTFFCKLQLWNIQSTVLVF